MLSLAIGKIKKGLNQMFYANNENTCCNNFSIMLNGENWDGVDSSFDSGVSTSGISSDSGISAPR